tara:strand:+ start:572 stop:751 length:180 start_codon:yes stop_codon:yes gene_type:complete
METQFVPTLFDADLAFETALKTNNKVSRDINHYMFMYGTDKELFFKHSITKDYVTLPRV